MPRMRLGSPPASFRLLSPTRNEAPNASSQPLIFLLLLAQVPENGFTS